MKNSFSFKLPSRWTRLPMVYKSDQIVAEISSWTNTTRVWLNDEIVDEKKGWRFDTVDKEQVSRIHKFCLPNGECVSLIVGFSLSDGMLFCSAEVDGTVFYEKRFSETEPDEASTSTDTFWTLIPAWIAGGVMGYFITQFFLGAL